MPQEMTKEAEWASTQSDIAIMVADFERFCAYLEGIGEADAPPSMAQVTEALEAYDDAIGSFSAARLIKAAAIQGPNDA